jgi:hypothetical protein
VRSVFATEIHQKSSLCNRSIEEISPKLLATGIESSGNWALISINETDEVLVNQGETFAPCASLIRVGNNSIVVSFTRTRERRELFFGGLSSAIVEQERSPATLRDGFSLAYGGYQTTVLSVNTYKVSYPPFSNSNTLPKVVYRNDRGAALYDDFDALGLGSDFESSTHDSTHKGVTIGENSSTSILGALGLTHGDRVVTINGQNVSNPYDISRIMKEAEDAPIHIGYASGDSSGVVTTTAMITKMG